METRFVMQETEIRAEGNEVRREGEVRKRCWK